MSDIAREAWFIICIKYFEPTDDMRVDKPEQVAGKRYQKDINTILIAIFPMVTTSPKITPLASSL